MAQRVVCGKPVRELPDFVRQGAHRKVDEMLSLYESGHPLWLVSSFGWDTPDGAAEIHLTIKDWA